MKATVFRRERIVSPFYFSSFSCDRQLGDLADQLSITLLKGSINI